MLRIKCSWSITEETFLIETPHDKFAEWFIGKCDQLGNDFCLSEFANDINHGFVITLIDDLRGHVEIVNKFLHKIKEPELQFPTDIEHQHSLNQLHKEWTRVHRSKPGVDTLMRRVDSSIFNSFHEVNRLIHVIEHSFVYILRSNQLWQTDNPFAMCEDWNEYNVSVCYTDFGRSSFEKWVVRDSDPNDLELSQWKYIGSSLLIDLNKPRPRSPPLEYIEYCKVHNISPVVSTWPLGNLVDIDANLGHVRRMFDRNLQIENNMLRFDLV